MNGMINQPILGIIMRQQRERLGISQEKFAVRSDISVSTLSDIETGKTNPHITTIKSICDTHNLPLEIFEK